MKLSLSKEEKKTRKRVKTISSSSAEYSLGVKNTEKQILVYITVPDCGHTRKNVLMSRNILISTNFHEFPRAFTFQITFTAILNAAQMIICDAGAIDEIYLKKVNQQYTKKISQTESLSRFFIAKWISKHIESHKN